MSSTDQPQETLTAEAQDDASAKPGKPLQRGPYLRISSPVTGCSEFNLPARPTTIGRSDEVDIKFADPAVSRTHAVITCEDNKFLVKDLGSKLGTTMNGEPITSHYLQHDDVIQISQYILLVSGPYGADDGIEGCNKSGGVAAHEVSPVALQHARRISDPRDSAGEDLRTG